MDDSYFLCDSLYSQYEAKKGYPGSVWSGENVG